MRGVVSLYFLVSIGVIVVVWAAMMFNKCIRFRNRLREAWSGIEVQLKRRHDLVPSLVECVKAYQKHESELLSNLAERRTDAQAADTLQKQNSSEAKLSRGIGRVLALSEDYPDFTS